MLFSLKSPLQYGEIIFQSKVIPLYLPKCSKFYHSECILYMEYTIPYMGNTVDFLPCMVETVGNDIIKRLSLNAYNAYNVLDVGKKRKPAKHGEMRWTPKQ